MNPVCSIEEYIQNAARLVEQRLDKLIPENHAPYRSLIQAARYSLLSGGKRLRPLLVLATLETLGENIEKGLEPACALEMIHTYSLIHDDLPCMDNDDFRRGKPSLHKAFPEGHAVLAGDFLLTYAFEVMVNSPCLSSEQKIELIEILAKSAGSPGMIGGQIMDIESEGQPVTIEFLKEIHERKTGALITASITCGAIIAQASSETKKILQQFGQELGFAFQVIDDVLDVVSNKNSDLKNNKTTYASLLGLEKARALALAHYEAGLAKLHQLPFNTSLLSSLARLLILRNK